MKKNIQFFLLLLALLLPVTATAHDFEVDGIYYNINGNEATVTYKGQYSWSEQSYSGNVTIPAAVTYGGTTYPVTTIGYEAFFECRSLTNVTIPNSVISIGDWAFFDCTGLTSVIIGNSVTTIGDYAFLNCNSMTSATIGNSVTSIGYCAFSECRSLSNIEISNSVISIGEWAFHDTDWYNNQPDGLVYMGQVAYRYKGTIPKNTRIVLKEGTLGIADFSFGYASQGKSIKTPNNNISVANLMAEDYSGLISIEIPNTVKVIGNGAFFGCSGLTNVTIPNSVTYIGSGAFSDCDLLEEVYNYIHEPSSIMMGDNVFIRYTNDYSERILYVPYGSSSSYQADSRWSDYFGSIVEMEPVPIESIQLNVTTAGLNEGATLQLSAMVQPEEGTSKIMNWASSYPSIATVDNNGLVTTHGVGTATITAMTTDGSNLSASCVVTLLPVGVKGDVNDDGRINISDVSDLIDMLLNGN